MGKRIIISIITFTATIPYIKAQHSINETTSSLDSLSYMVEMQGSMSFDNGKPPLWLNANKYGLSSLEKNNGYLRTAAIRPLSVDNSKKWGIGYGLDLVGAANYTSKAFVHQAYAEGRWLKGVLTILARLNFDYDTWYLGLYADHFFEDHSQMLLLEYDGYGTGAEWNVKKDNRLFMYSLKDIMLGVDLRLKSCFTWINNVVLEYLYTKYQSGPVYHDHTQLMPDHIGGLDNYYNHHIFPGWQHWGQVMGNPLYRSPIYNDDNRVMVMNNRFVAWHLVVGGAPAPNLSYRALATYQKSWGTYYFPFIDPHEDICVMGEILYEFDEESFLKGWSIKGL